MMKNQFYKYIKYIVKTGLAVVLCTLASNVNSMRLMTEEQLEIAAKSQTWEVRDEDMQAATEALAQIKKYNNPQQWDDNLCELHIVACCGLRSRGFRAYFETCMERFCENYELCMPKTKFYEMCNEQNIDFKVLYKNLINDLGMTRVAYCYYEVGKEKDFTDGLKDEAILYFKKSAFAYLIYIQKNSNFEEYLGRVHIAWEDALGRFDF